MNFIVYRTAKSYFFFKKIGYFYYKNLGSISNNLFTKSEFRIKCVLYYLNIIYEYSKNTKYEKDLSNFLLTRFYKDLIINTNHQSIKNKEIFEYFNDLIKKYLDCKFIDKENKYFLQKYKINFG